MESVITYNNIWKSTLGFCLSVIDGKLEPQREEYNLLFNYENQYSDDLLRNYPKNLHSP